MNNFKGAKLKILSYFSFLKNIFLVKIICIFLKYSVYVEKINFNFFAVENKSEKYIEENLRNYYFSF